MSEHELESGGKHPVGSEMWGAKLRRRAQTLHATLETGYMELAEILYKVYDTPLNGDPKNPPIYRSWGFETWEDWCDHELHLKPEKARYLRRIHYVINVELAGLDDHTRRRLSKIGASKVGKLLRVLTVQNATRWCELAETLTNQELVRAVQDSLAEAEKRYQEAAVNGTEDTVQPEPVAVTEMKTRFFSLFPEQLSTVNDAITRAMELSASKKASHNLTLICMDFLANNDFRLANDENMRLRYIAKLESLLGKKFVMVDPQTKQVEYGLDALELLVDKGGADDDGSDEGHAAGRAVERGGDSAAVADAT